MEETEKLERHTHQAVANGADFFTSELRHVGDVLVKMGVSGWIN